MLTRIEVLPSGRSRYYGSAYGTITVIDHDRDHLAVVKDDIN